MNQQYLELLVYNKLSDEPTGHDYLHAMRVKNHALQLLKTDMDSDVVITSALVHDLIDRKLEDKYKLTEQDLSNELQHAGLDSKQITHVFDIIHNMSFSKGKIPTSIEGKIVQDADRLDAIGAIGIARAFSYGGHNNRLLYDPTTTDGTDTVSHFYQKLFLLQDQMNTKQAKIIAKKRTQFMKEYINQFWNEVKEGESK